jgi:hypothetical protein
MRLLKAYGATLVLTPGAGGMKEAVRVAAVGRAGRAVTDDRLEPDERGLPVPALAATVDGREEAGGTRPASENAAVLAESASASVPGPEDPWQNQGGVGRTGSASENPVNFHG